MDDANLSCFFRDENLEEEDVQRLFRHDQEARWFINISRWRVKGGLLRILGERLNHKFVVLIRY